VYYNKVTGGNMSRRYKNKQLSKVKAALKEQQTAAIDINVEEGTEPQDLTLSKEDIKKMFKATVEPGEQKPTTKKQLSKLKRNLRKQKVIPKKTISWQHEIGDLVQIPSDARIRSKVIKTAEDSFGIIVKMTEGDNETKLHDSQSLVFSPSGRSWYYTKTLKKV